MERDCWLAAGSCKFGEEEVEEAQYVVVVVKAARVGEFDALEYFLNLRVGVSAVVVVRDRREKRKKMPRRDLEVLAALCAFMTGTCTANSSMALFVGKKMV